MSPAPLIRIRGTIQIEGVKLAPRKLPFILMWLQARIQAWTSSHSALYRLYPPFLWLQDIMRGEKILQAAPCCDRRLLNPLSDAVLQQRLLQ